MEALGSVEFNFSITANRYFETAEEAEGWAFSLLNDGVPKGAVNVSAGAGSYAWPYGVAQISSFQQTGATVEVTWRVIPGATLD